MDCSSLFVLTVFNYKHKPDACLLLCCQPGKVALKVNPPLKSRKLGIPNMPSRSVLILTAPLHFVVIHNCIPDAALYIPDYLLETCGRYHLYETGFLIYSG